MVGGRGGRRRDRGWGGKGEEGWKEGEEGWKEEEQAILASRRLPPMVVTGVVMRKLGFSYVKAEKSRSIKPGRTLWPGVEVQTWMVEKQIERKTDMGPHGSRRNVCLRHTSHLDQRKNPHIHTYPYVATRLILAPVTQTLFHYVPSPPVPPHPHP